MKDNKKLNTRERGRFLDRKYGRVTNGVKIDLG